MKAGITTRFKKSLRTRAFRAGAYSVFAGLLVAAIVASVVADRRDRKAGHEPATGKSE
jgi:hypothetical protein